MNDLPPRVIVCQHGHYWRDYSDESGWGLSMPPVSSDNLQCHAVATFNLAASRPEPIQHWNNENSIGTLVLDASRPEPEQFGRVDICRDCDDAGGVCDIHRLPARLARPEPGADPSAREWLEHAKHGLQSLSDLYHDGGEKGDGITVREFRDGIDFVWRQIDSALAALPASPRYAPAPGGVHTHGVEDGPGLACQEYLIGACALPASPEDGLDVELLKQAIRQHGDEQDDRESYGWHCDLPDCAPDIARSYAALKKSAGNA